MSDVQTGAEIHTYTDESGEVFYHEPESGQWLVMPKEWLDQGEFIESDSIEFERAWDEDGTEYTIYRQEDGTLMYLDWDTSEWAVLPEDVRYGAA